MQLEKDREAKPGQSLSKRDTRSTLVEVLQNHFLIRYWELGCTKCEMNLGTASSSWYRFKKLELFSESIASIIFIFQWSFGFWYQNFMEFKTIQDTKIIIIYGTLTFHIPFQKQTRTKSISPWLGDLETNDTNKRHPRFTVHGTLQIPEHLQPTEGLLISPFLPYLFQPPSSSSSSSSSSYDSA